MEGKKIIIKGESLHYVGFRPYLLSNALKLKIKNFEAENIDDEGKEVMVLLIGDANQITEFINWIKTKKLPLPDITKVIEVTKEEIDTVTAINIPVISEYQERLNVDQLNNIVQGGLKLDQNLGLLRTESSENFKKLDQNLGLLRTESSENFKELDKNVGSLRTEIGFLRTETSENLTKLDKNLVLLRTETSENFTRLETKYELISKGMFAVVEELKETNKALGERIEKTEKNIEKLLEILVSRSDQNK